MLLIYRHLDTMQTAEIQEDRRGSDEVTIVRELYIVSPCAGCDTNRLHGGTLIVFIARICHHRSEQCA